MEIAKELVEMAVEVMCTMLEWKLQWRVLLIMWRWSWIMNVHQVVVDDAVEKEANSG